MSQTVLVHVKAPAAMVHVPLTKGVTWLASLGTWTPLADVGVQAFNAMLHQLPVVQSVSNAQPIAVTMCGPINGVEVAL